MAITEPGQEGISVWHILGERAELELKKREEALELRQKMLDETEKKSGQTSASTRAVNIANCWSNSLMRVWQLLRMLDQVSTEFNDYCYTIIFSEGCI